MAYFLSKLFIGCSNGDDPILVDDQELSVEDNAVSAPEISTDIQCERDEDKERNTSLTNLFIEFGDMSERLGRYI